MPKLNRRKFVDCLVKYKRECLSSHWRRSQAHKFYFANQLTSRVNLAAQDVTAIHSVCTRIEEKDFYFSDSATKIEGLQFLPKTGNPRFTERITKDDVQLFKRFEKKSCFEEADFAGRGISFHALSGWLGTLLPEMFMPVTSLHLRHSISHLFDLRLKIYQEHPYDYFMWSQECFLITKQALKEFELRSLYLADINSYMSMHYPKYGGKRSYSEADWNWLTQDFHLFIFREMLHMDTVRMFESRINPELAAGNFRIAEGMDIYIP